MKVSTTEGVKEYDGHAGHKVINTTSVVEENLVNEDETPEPLFTVPGDGWAARIAGKTVPVVMFIVQDDGETYGVGVDEETGRIDITKNLKDREGFETYVKEDS